ncbi:vitamin B6 photo-protection and homoeostasis-domain-containing protein [Infundibulicybe gibba]|nr:vitamin B6 photo-protection and homoeostasis-domain-containing protein [Infundibulicybe gibba]
MGSPTPTGSYFRITERDEAGRVSVYNFQSGRGQARVGRAVDAQPRQMHTGLLDFAKKVFLPAGYPDTVSPDYLRYQILNALQAFCSSLAGLLSSRAVLEGFGVGDASATATHAMLLTVLQDVFSRLTTIFAAYFIGSLLSPEAKTYRLLADILNDVAIILDTLSPLLGSPQLPVHIPGLRVAALCLSAACRSLCGIAAGGSKAAITLHFATPLSGKGDIGDLNAKDSSKETVLALLGMLLGTLIIPHLTTPWTIYPVLLLLVFVHLALNYIGLRGIALRTLNRQRAALAWTFYRTHSRAPSPTEIAHLEHILTRPDVFRSLHAGQITGTCTLGASLPWASIPPALLPLFAEEEYVLWPEHHPDGRLHVAVSLKAEHAFRDQLRAWVHAAEVCVAGRSDAAKEKPADVEALALAWVRRAQETVQSCFSEFVHEMRQVGWDMDDGMLMAGAPSLVIMRIEDSPAREDKED